MPSFVCDLCQDVLKKAKVSAHVRRCPSDSVSCVDCGVHFFGDDFVAHTSCLTEAEKWHGQYAPKANGKAKGKGKDGAVNVEDGAAVGSTEEEKRGAKRLNTEAAGEEVGEGRKKKKKKKKKKEEEEKKKEEEEKEEKEEKKEKKDEEKKDKKDKSKKLKFKAIVRRCLKKKLQEGLEAVPLATLLSDVQEAYAAAAEDADGRLSPEEVTAKFSLHALSGFGPSVSVLASLVRPGTG